ncbi:MAG: IS701 family transposase [Deltaproteobacteria bacterium]|nr:IS701 family transposase [Nannocystaceae bacterium]
MTQCEADLPGETAEQRLETYLRGIGSLLRDRRRRESFAMYACGLFGEGDRKSAEPVAARLCGAADRAEATHQKLLHFLARSEWEDRPVRMHAARFGLREMQRRRAVTHWIIDDTGFLKQGKFSPGVKRQYTGSAGKVTNCQVAVSLTLSNEQTQLPIDFALFVPEDWAADPKRCAAAKIPKSIGYKPKWQLALDMVDAAIADDLPRGVVLADADYGNKTAFRDRLDERGLQYAVAVQLTTRVRRVRTSGVRRRVDKPMSVEELAFSLSEKNIRKTTWREGTGAPMASRFAVVRVEPMPTDDEPRPEQWLVIEWGLDSHRPDGYTLSTLSKDISRKQLIASLKERWRTERAYQDLKGELGLDHFEGRSFPGWHHHVTVVLACYAFMVAEQMRGFPPSRHHAHDSSDAGAIARAA